MTRPPSYRYILKNNALWQIEQSLLRRKATVKHWQQKGWNMAKAGKWYYAYTIEDDTVIIEDACHEQNMHDDK